MQVPTLELAQKTLRGGERAAESVGDLKRALAPLDPSSIAAFRRRHSGGDPIQLPERRSLSASLFALLPRFGTNSRQVTAIQTSSSNPRPIDGATFRRWLLDALRDIQSSDGPQTIPYGATGESTINNRYITLETAQDQAANTWLKIEGQTFDFLDLSDIDMPSLVIVVSKCMVDWIDLGRSSFAEFEAAGLAPNPTFPGIVIKAADTKIGGTFQVWNGQGHERVARANEYITIDAPRMRADQVILWGIEFTGAQFLQQISDKDAYDALFSLFSRSLMLTETSIGRFLAYNTHFTGGLASLRHAAVERQVKFERCLFTGYKLPRLYGERVDRDLRDEFDHDDLRPLNGLVLDLSRARLGSELRFRKIDSESRGWMNWSYATTNVLADDTSLWNGDQVSAPSLLRSLGFARPPRIRFRLNGFRYSAVSTGRVGALKVETLGPEEGGPNTGLVSRDAVDSAKKESEGVPQLSKEKDKQPHISEERIAWLCCQVPDDLSDRFIAQPWTIAASVFRVQGDYDQANRVLHEREKYWHWSLLVKFYRSIDVLDIFRPWRILLQWKWGLGGLFLFHAVLSRLPGFGYKLWRPFALFVVAWLWFASFYSVQYANGFLMRNPDTSTAKNPVLTLLFDEQLVPRKLPTFSLIGEAKADAKRQCTILPEEPKCPKPMAAPITPTTSVSSATDIAAPASGSGPAGSSSANASGTSAAGNGNGMDDYPRFSALAYSFDVMLPAIDFGQGPYWIPGYRKQSAKDRDQKSACGPTATWHEYLTEISNGGCQLDVTSYAYGTQILLGWYLTAVISIAWTGLLGRLQPAS